MDKRLCRHFYNYLGWYVTSVLLTCGCGNMTPEGRALVGGVMGEAINQELRGEQDRRTAEVYNQGRVEAARVANQSTASGGAEIYDGKMNDGGYYRGQLLNTFPHGTGHYEYPGGAVYDGEFLNGKRHGLGTFVMPDGRKYVGNWVNNEAQGQGQDTFANGVFIGEHRSGRTYQGTATLNSGIVVAGTWGTENRGTISYPDGGTYKGQWDGTPTFEGETLGGYWVVERPNGEGTMTWPDGRVYVGDWRQGKMHGVGVLTHSNGKRDEGLWRDGDFVGAIVKPEP